MNDSKTTSLLVASDAVELLEDGALTLEQLAQACELPAQWISNRVRAGVLVTVSGVAAQTHSSEWRFSVATLTRARRVADLERQFDADPQLAALTVDLMEEVALLRKRLQSWADGTAGDIGM